MFFDELEGADIYDPQQVFISNFKIIKTLYVTEILKDLLIVVIRSILDLLMESFDNRSGVYFYIPKSLLEFSLIELIDIFLLFQCPLLTKRVLYVINRIDSSIFALLMNLHFSFHITCP